MTYESTQRVMDRKGNWVLVNVTIDIAVGMLARELASRAIKNKSGKAKLMQNVIVATITDRK